MKKQAFVVSGGSKGLGKALGKLAYQAGYPVALLGRNQLDLESAQKEIQSSTHSKQVLSIHPLDLTDEKKTQFVFADIHQIHHEIGVLVNNAATWTGGQAIQKMSAQDMRTSLDLNFFSAFHAIKQTLSLWEQNGKQALCIINVGATASLRGGKHSAAFAVAKTALRIFSQSLAKEYGPLGVHVAHVVIDGLLDNPRTHALNPQLAQEKFMNLESVARSLLQVAEQEPSCFTFEWDIRPYNEVW